MRNLTNNMATAFQALRGSTLRSALTMLGITIGVSSVVLLVALGQGVEKEIRGELDRIGSNMVAVLPGKVDENGLPNFMSLAAVSTLTWRDVDTVKRTPGVVECVPLMILSGSVERDGQSYPALVLGMTWRMPTIFPTRAIEGRLLGPGDTDARVCVLAYEPRRALFGDAPAVGQTVGIHGHPYTVVGVLEPQPTGLMSMFSSFANVVSVPLTAARDVPGAQVNRILLKVDYARDPKPVLASIRRTLLANHGGREDFGVLTQEQMLGSVYRVFGIVTAFLAGISAISLVVAGVGVMNIMLVTVTERTREIGIRKAVGARRADVFMQFLVEAVTISLVGGLAGIGLAVAVCAITAAHSPLQPVITWRAVALAFGVCLAVGVVFGVAPAIRAARQDPIEALRRE